MSEFLKNGYGVVGNIDLKGVILVCIYGKAIIGNAHNAIHARHYSANQ